MHKGVVRFGAATIFMTALAVAACGKSGGSSPASPTGSSAPSQPAGSASGATIAGAVMSSAGTASVRTMGGAPIVVSIVGTSMSVTVDGSGRFTLKNVPPGDVTLSFTGNGINAQITITGVGANDQIRLTVRVNGTTVDVDQNEHQMANNQAELEGRVAATNCGANPPTITVGTMTPITVNVQNAQIRHGNTTLTCSQIKINDNVEARGTKNGTTLIATEVKVETEHEVENEPGDNDDHDEDENKAEVKGTVSGAPAGHACPAFTFTVGTTTVTTTAATRFEDTTCAGVINGITVEAEGTRTSATAITATKVEKK